jgi:predicted nicotinamide N-methyase
MKKSRHRTSSRPERTRFVGLSNSFHCQVVKSATVFSVFRIKGAKMIRPVTALTVCAGSIMLAAMATGTAGASETVNYTYDAKGRVVKVAHSGTVNNNIVANYGFDKADNRVNMNVTGAP